MLAFAQRNAFLMRGRYSSGDAAQAANNQIPLILYKRGRPMDKGRNGARYFRNPPQPHMCIQDFIEDTNEPCFINVLSWVKISTPRRPEDPIPLYGGMQVPHNSSTALSLSSHFGSKGQPIIFAVMANPEILRLSGKTAQDPSDRDALVELMIDFVEAMNPDMRFKRSFTVLRDRDLAGELKDIWLAVQAKRERERGENGRRSGSDRDRTREPRFSPPTHSPIHSNNPQSGSLDTATDLEIQQTQHDPPLSLDTTSPSMQTLNQPSRAIKHEEESVYSLIRSHYEQEFGRVESNVTAQSLCSEQASEVRYASMFSADGSVKEPTGIIFPVFSESLEKEQIPILGATEMHVSEESVHSSLPRFSSYRQHGSEMNAGNVVCASSANRTENCRHQSAFTNSKIPVSSVGSRSHEDLLPTSGDTTCLKFAIGHDHNTVAIP